MATAADKALANLGAMLQNATARLAELDALPVVDRAKTTYTDGGRTFSWGEYRASLAQEVKDYGAMVESIQKGQQVQQGPFTFIGRVGC